MLILTRKPGESVYIGDKIKITIVEIKGHQIRVGIDAPTDLRIYREEIYLQILEENKNAAEAAGAPDSGLEGLSKAWKDRTKQDGGEKKENRPGIASLTASTVPTKDPQVVMKKRKKTDE